MLRHISLIYDGDEPIYPPELTQLQSIHQLCRESTYRFIRESSWGSDMTEEDMVGISIQRQANTGEFITVRDVSFCFDLEIRNWKYMDEWGVWEDEYSVGLAWITNYYKMMRMIGAEIGYLV